MTIADALALLPEDEYGVAWVLYDAGIRGRRNTCLTCPLAGFLTLVCGCEIWVGTYKADERYGHGSAPLPIECRDFAEEFDRGFWPELEAA